MLKKGLCSLLKNKEQSSKFEMSLAKHSSHYAPRRWPKPKKNYKTPKNEKNKPAQFNGKI